MLKLKQVHPIAYLPMPLLQMPRNTTPGRRPREHHLSYFTSSTYPILSLTMEAEVRPPPSPSLSSSPPPPPSKASIYKAFNAYPFTQDPDFQAGLTSLTSNPSLSEDELSSTIFQAQCFYFARRYNLPPIDSADYESWLLSQQQAAAIQAQTQPPAEGHATHIAAQPLGQAPAIPPTTFTSPSSPPPDPSPGPHYPASFESIVDLITRNQPIPGIEEIPDTIIDASLSAPNQTARRKKPWETDDAVKDMEPVLSDAVGDEPGKPTGVVGILQPIKKLAEGEGTNPGALESDDSKEEGTATLSNVK
jgi:hypothetical protein